MAEIGITPEQVIDKVRQNKLDTKIGKQITKPIEAYDFFVSQKGLNCPYTKMAGRLLIQRAQELGIIDGLGSTNE